MLNHTASDARSVHAEQTAALIEANAPLRARRERRRILLWGGYGLTMLVFGLAAPRSWDALRLAGSGRPIARDQ